MALIDTLAVSSAVAAYATRKVRDAYAGACMRVRRSSDNAELDIGFDSNGELDTVALLAHTGAGSGYVRTWYDQSGNGINVINATAANQPRIVNAGVVEVMDAKPALRFLSASSTKLESTAGAMPNATYFTGNNVMTACAYLCASALSQFNLWNLRAGADTWQRFSDASSYDGNYNVTRIQIVGAGIPNTNRRVFTAIRTADFLEYQIDGALTGRVNNAQSISTTFVQFGLYLSGTYFDGHIGELIIQASNNKNDRYSLELDQGSRYGVTIGSPAGAVSGEEFINAMFQTPVEGTFKFVHALRTMMAVIAGDATGLTGNPTFTGVDTATERVLATIAGEARTITSLDGSKIGESFSAPTATAQALVTALLTAAVENGITVKGVIRLLMAYLHGDATGLDSAPAFKSLSGSKTRITGSVDAGVRTVTTVDVTD